MRPKHLLHERHEVFEWFLWGFPTSIVEVLRPTLDQIQRCRGCAKTDKSWEAVSIMKNRVTIPTLKGKREADEPRCLSRSGMDA